MNRLRPRSPGPARREPAISTAEVPASALGTLKYLARGGTAKIYRVPGYSLPSAGPLIYKEYSARIRQSAGPALLPGLRSLAEFRANLDSGTRARLDQRAIWPLVVTTADDGSATGILLREIPGEFFHGTRGVLEFQQLFNADDDARRAGFPVVDQKTRLILLTRFAEAMKLLHDLGIIFGDVSAKNVAFCLGAKPHIILVDTDSARRKGTRGPFGAQPHTPTWEPPEAVSASRQIAYLKRLGSGGTGELGKLSDTWKRQTTETDVYKFGLMVVRVLDYGRQRTQNKNPEEARRVLQARVSGAAARLLDRTLGNEVKARPTMDEWYQALRGHTGPPARHPARPVPRASSSPGSDRERSSASPRWRLVEGMGWVRE